MMANPVWPSILRIMPVLAAALVFAAVLPGNTNAAPAANSIAVRLTMDAPADAAARTWRFEVADDAGAVVSTLSLNAIAGAPSTALSPALSPGHYTVRQLLGHDTATGCVSGALWAV